MEDAWSLGVLESRPHQVWASPDANGSLLEDRPVYNKTACFDAFPFPEATEHQKAVIRDLAEHLDAPRKAAPDRGVTITGMYNLLVKLRSGEPFNDREREQHERSQTEILRQLHDELDAAVAEAYGWPVDLPESEILMNLVALNKERATEEARGVVRWLRPEYQAPQEVQQPATPVLVLEIDQGQVAAGPVTEPQPWPKDLKDQLAALRSLLLSSERLWTFDSISSSFKSRGRFREGIQAQLDLLADLRVLERIETADGPRWHRPQAMGA